MNEWRYLKPMVSTNSTCKGIVGLWRYFMECGGWPPLLRFSALPKSPIKSGSKPPHSKRCNCLFGLPDGHLVLYTLHAFYVADIFADQVDFGGVLGLATYSDHAIFRHDLGVNGAG